LNSTTYRNLNQDIHNKLDDKPIFDTKKGSGVVIPGVEGSFSMDKKQMNNASNITSFDCL
jgi:hypothetical protein